MYSSGGVDSFSDDDPASWRTRRNCRDEFLSSLFAVVSRIFGHLRVQWQNEEAGREKIVSDWCPLHRFDQKQSDNGFSSSTCNKPEHLFALTHKQIEEKSKLGLHLSTCETWKICVNCFVFNQPIFWSNSREREKKDDRWSPFLCVLIIISRKK